MNDISTQKVRELLERIQELEQERDAALERVRVLEEQMRDGGEHMQALLDRVLLEKYAALERVRVLESQVEASKGLYKHVKTEGLYYVITEATLETTGELVVVYRSVSDGHDWVRPADEFFDGRFVRLEEAQP